jgi:hypothetical protein
MAVPNKIYERWEWDDGTVSLCYWFAPYGALWFWL